MKSWIRIPIMMLMVAMAASSCDDSSDDGATTYWTVTIEPEYVLSSPYWGGWGLVTPHMEAINERGDRTDLYGLEEIKGFIGTIVTEIAQVSRSYKEARMALNVGKIFYTAKRIHMYNTLGIGRLIYQLPENLCRLFIREVFTKQQPDSFDEETITTINMFFDNNLNVSETARQLFVHRNTLVYRLEKLYKATGLDIRVFDDALTFKIALMVESYLRYLEENQE